MKGILAIVFCISTMVLSACSPMMPDFEESSTAAVNTETESSIDVKPLDMEAFDSYLSDLVQFFQVPAARMDDLPRNRNLAYFLLAESFRIGTEAGKAYTQNSEQLYQIPNEEIKDTAEKLLGIMDFEPASISDWPFSQEPGNEFQLYSETDEPPYGHISTVYVEWTNETVTADTLVETEVVQEEHEEVPTVYLRYEFRRMEDEEGEYYQLQSIAEKD